MASGRKRSTINSTQQPSNIPLYHYPQPNYGYMPASYFYPPYERSEYPYDYSNQLFYPVNEYGEIIGPATSLPPVTNPYYPQYYPHPDYMSNATTYGSHMHSPRRNQVVYSGYHSPPIPIVRESSRRETLPPIQRHPFAATRSISPNGEKFKRYAVSDLTERGSASSAVKQRDAIRSIKRYDNLRRSYN